MHFDPVLEELSKKIPSYLMALDGLLPDKVKILFVRQTSLTLLKRLRNEREMDVSIIDRNVTNSAVYQKYNITSYTGDAHSQLARFGRESFDYVIFDHSLNTFADVYGVLSTAGIVAEHVICITENNGYWRKRINFLLRGSFSSGGDYNDWFNTKNLRFCGVRDFMSLAESASLIIERACYFDSKGMIHNLYDIRKMPSIFADKLMFILGHRDNYISITAPDGAS